MFLCATFAILGLFLAYYSFSDPSNFGVFSALFSIFCFFASFKLYKIAVIVEKIDVERKEKKKRVDEIIKNQIIETRERIYEIEKRLGFKSIGAKNVGGSGYPLSQGQQVNFGINESSIIIIKIKDTMDVLEIPFEEVSEVEISGPGTVATNAGIVGGGFGLEGFIKGAVAAAIINAATTRKTTNTFIRVMTATGEIYIHTSEIDPDALKIKMSPVFVYLKNKSNQQLRISSSSISEEIERLQKLLQDGILSQEELDAAKKKVLNN